MKKRTFSFLIIDIVAWIIHQNGTFLYRKYMLVLAKKIIALKLWKSGSTSRSVSVRPRTRVQPAYHKPALGFDSRSSEPRDPEGRPFDHSPSSGGSHGLVPWPAPRTIVRGVTLVSIDSSVNSVRPAACGRGS